MKVNLFAFQNRALAQLRGNCASAQGEFHRTGNPQVISFTAPTGAGKTVIMSSLIESILGGDDQYVEQQDAIFVWLSDSPQLNQQSRDKIETLSDKIPFGRCVTIAEDSFDQEYLEDGYIYFLNTQKLSTSSNLTKCSDSRQYTIWETLANTIAEKADKLYFIIDEAHRGMQGKEAGKATTIMQKFILGSTKDNLPVVPIVIGMSATIDRFNQLVKNSASTIRPVRVTPKEVRDSGLLKDRIIITYSAKTDVQKDWAVLEAATDEWVNKCRHWDAYCREQHHYMVNPIFIVQVQNGNASVLSETDLDECLQHIEQHSGRHFAEGEVVHAFGEGTGTLNINGLAVPYEEPSRISDNKNICVVFFKETLSTGWDCPRAETMMSFRHYSDATAIAQLLGRMVRTPIQKHILIDDMLNDVRLFLPHFDADKVDSIVDELQNAEGGELPTDIMEEDFEQGTYTTLTTKPTHHRKPDFSGMGDLFGTTQNTDTQTTSVSTEPTNIQQPQVNTPTHSPSITKPTTTPIVEPILDLEDGINRQEIVDFINNQALRTYNLRTFQMNNYLKSLYKLSNFLFISGLYIHAREEVLNDIVSLIHSFITDLQEKGKYASLKEKVMKFEMLSKVYDAFGEPIVNKEIKDLYSESSVDLDRQVRSAEKILGDGGVCVAYGKKYLDIDNIDEYKVDLILFASDDEALKSLEKFAKTKYYQLNDTYRQKINSLADDLKTKYRDIVRDSSEVSDVPFFLSENMSVRVDPDGQEYSTHLYVAEDTGVAKIKLNGWEKKVIAAEEKRPDFRTWYRNPAKGTGALTLVHYYKGTNKPFYPDFLIVRKVDGNYIIDILEPHDNTRDDNVSKAKALAQYAGLHTIIGRAQLIRLIPSSLVGEELKRLDFAAHSELREKVQHITTNEELDNLFSQYGE